jgi:hypothetical protein
MAAQQVISSTTQLFLDIFDITNDILILKDGSTALIITVNAMNFGLLAEPEQDAIMYAYAGLLNSLNYPIQIVIRSQTKDVTGYLGLLKDEEEKNTSETKKRWIRKYREFVADLITERNVLDKKFYVVIPASALEMGLLPPSTVIPGIKQPDLTTVERSVILEKAQEILEPKRDHLMGQFGRIGLVSRQLQTQEIIQLFYLSYNPEAADGQQITDTSSYTAPLVKADIQGGFMDSMLTQSPTVPAAAAVASTPQPVAPMMPVAQAMPVSPQMPVEAPQMAAPTPVEPVMPIAQMPVAQPQPVAAAPVASAPVAMAQPAPVVAPPTPVMPTTPAGPVPEMPFITTPAAPVTPQPSGQPLQVVQPQPIAPAPVAMAQPIPVQEAEMQNAINSSLQQLGGTPATAPVTQTTTPAINGDLTPPQTSSDALPPLPEI